MSFIHGTFETQVSGKQFPGVSAQVLGFRNQVSGSRCQVTGFGFQVPGSRYQVTGVRFQVPGARFHAPCCWRDHVSDFKDLVPRQNVENLHTKDVLRLSGNYELTNSTLILSLARFKYKKNFQVFTAMVPEIRTYKYRSSHSEVSLKLVVSKRN